MHGMRDESIIVSGIAERGKRRAGGAESGITESGIAERRRVVLRSCGEILALGLVYCVWGRLTGLYLPCPVRALTGYLCPGCGITHMFLAILRGSWREAWEANRLLCVLLPVGGVYALRRCRKYVREGVSSYSPAEMVGLAAAFGAAVFFGILRNLY